LLIGIVLSSGEFTKNPIKNSAGRNRNYPASPIGNLSMGIFYVYRMIAAVANAYRYIV